MSTVVVVVAYVEVVLMSCTGTRNLQSFDDVVLLNHLICCVGVAVDNG